MTTWWAETISVVTRRLLLAVFFRILANSRSKAFANENEQNRFLTLQPGLNLRSNGVYKEKLHFSKQLAKHHTSQQSSSSLISKQQTNVFSQVSQAYLCSHSLSWQSFIPSLGAILGDIDYTYFTEWNNSLGGHPIFSRILSIQSQGTRTKSLEYLQVA